MLELQFAETRQKRMLGKRNRMKCERKMSGKVLVGRFAQCVEGASACFLTSFCGRFSSRTPHASNPFNYFPLQPDRGEKYKERLVG